MTDEPSPELPRPRALDDETSAELAAFAARLERRRDLPLQAEGWGAGRVVADAVDLFAAGRELAATIAGRALPRWETKELDEDAVPERVRIGLRKYFQKPFHLWNVERIVDSTPFKLVRQPPWTVGKAADLSEEQRPPRTFEKATRALVKLVEEAAAWRSYDRTALAARKRLLVDPLPFGKKDEAPEAPSQGRSVLIDIAGPGGPGALPSWFDPRRLRAMGPTRGPTPPPPRPAAPPGHGGFSLEQPDDAPPRRGPPPGTGPGGFSFEQPDDDDDAPPRRGPPPGMGPGGFSFEQPDDD